ncbi:MAG: hypothetical protein RIQ89_954 [Bacteroidota bacterium]
MNFFKICILCLSLFSNVVAQSFNHVVYERKTNLYKKFADDNVKDWIDESQKIKYDQFELFFNDSQSVFKPVESELREQMEWSTDKNSVYQNFNLNQRLSIKKVWGESAFTIDSLYTRKWKITDSKRIINGQQCLKAIWQPNDSTRIYAWFSIDMPQPVGPESFYGLPGVILGLATEDGGVIYFATHIEEQILPKNIFDFPSTKTKIYTSAELKAKLEKDYGKNKWGKAMIKNLFGYW